MTSFLDKPYTELTPSECISIIGICPDFFLHSGIIQHVEETAKKKVVTKAMSKEEFEESEHPRDKEGQFTDKPGVPKKTPKLKLLHGGKRPGAGRLPLSASSAVETLKTRYRVRFPSLSEDEVLTKVKADAIKKGKPDWVEYLDDPAKYLKKEQEEALEAAKAKYRNLKLGRKPVGNVDTRVDTAAVRSSVEETKARFDRDVAKAGSLREAWRTFRDENEDETKRNYAKIILGIAGIASLAGLTALFIKRPNLGQFKAAKETLTVGGKEYAKLNLPKNGFPEPDPLEIPGLSWVKIRRVIRPGTKTELPGDIRPEESSAIRRFFGLAYKKLFPESYKRRIPPKFRGGKQPYPIEIAGWGKKWTGFDPEVGYVIDMGSKSAKTGKYSKVALMNRGRYHPRPGDMDPISGEVFVVGDEKNPKILWEKLLEAHYKNGTLANIKRQIESKLGADGLKEFERLVKEVHTEGRVQFNILSPKKPTKVTEGISEEFKNLLRDSGLGATRKGIVKGKKELKDVFIPQGEMMPKYVYQDFTGVPEEIAKQREAFKGGWAAFMNDQVLPGLSRKVLTQLTASGVVTAGAGYYFHQDIVDLTEAIKESRAREELKPKVRRDVSDEIALERERRKRLVAEERAHQQAIKRREKEESAYKTRHLYLKEIVDLVKELPSYFGKTYVNDLEKLAAGTAVGRPAQYVIDRLKGELEEYREKIMSRGTESEKNTLRELEAKIQEWEGAPTGSVAFGEELKSGDYEIIVKAFLEEEGIYEEEKHPSIDEITDVMADEISGQIEDLSQSCRIMIENGIPGHSRFEEANDAINSLVASFAIASGTPIKREIPTTVEKELKTAILILKEMSGEVPSDDDGTQKAMSAQSDSGGGLFTQPGSQVYYCNKCDKLVTDEQIRECRVLECPLKDFTKELVGDTEPDDMKYKEGDHGEEIS